jgi:hypothetical protein
VIAGHFGFAAGVKGRAPSVPLWALVLASQWLEIIFVPLFATGLERMTPVGDAKPGAYGGVLIYADYSHSLVGAAVLSLLFGGLAAIRYGQRSGTILGAVAFSHWLLDLLVHRGDMAILPANVGELPRLGFGLWRYPVASAGLELTLVVGGAALYWAAARRVAGNDAQALRRARLCGALALGSGLLTLGLSVLGM